MFYTVSITSQGQVSIPAPLRRKLGLNKLNKAIISEKEGKVIIEPVKDLLELRGSLKTKLKPEPKKARQAFIQYLAQRAAKK